MDDLRRQVQTAIYAFLFIIPVGIAGFMYFENVSFIDATYATIITLTTIGFGDITPKSQEGRIFTIFLVLIGLGAVVNIFSSASAFINNPILQQARQRRRTQRRVAELEMHYIICGMGEMVDKTVQYLLQGANTKRQHAQEVHAQQINRVLDPLFGKKPHGFRYRAKGMIHHVALNWMTTIRRQRTILDVVVVITQDATYAEELRTAGLLVIEGDPADDDVQKAAGVERARAMMVILNSDTETLLTVLTARSLMPTLHITAAVLDSDLSQKMTRVGATAIIIPFDAAGQFLNSTTLRPAVNDFFYSLIFDFNIGYRLTQLEITAESSWLGQAIGDIHLEESFRAGALGIRYEDATYGFSPAPDHVLQESEVLIVAAPIDQVAALEASCRSGDNRPMNAALFQRLPLHKAPPKHEKTYSLIEAGEAIRHLSKHFIICGDDRVARSAINRLNPERPFVIISNDNTLTSALLKRGFRVVHGNPSSEETLRRAGVDRAQAMMVALDSKADSVLTILAARELNRRLLITATAYTDDMVEKLQRAGADRLISPFHVAAQFILLTTTHPDLAAFLESILFNYRTGLETTEIYMEDDSIWIGKTLAELQLQEKYGAGVIGIREQDRKHFYYAPPGSHVIKAQEVLIIVTPMTYSDELREAAHGGTLRRPQTLRAKVLESQKWTPEQIKALVDKGRS